MTIRLGYSLCVTLFMCTCTSAGILRYKESTAVSACQVHNPTTGGKLDYVYKNDDEWTHRDIIPENAQVYLFCKVENFCNIQWYNNATGTDQLITSEPGYISFEEDNQTLLIEKTRLSDGKFYACKPSKGTELLEPRTVLLQVMEIGTGGLVPLTHPKCNKEEAKLGASAMFYCEYSVGDKKPVYVNTYWKKQNENDTEYDSITFVQEDNINNTEVTTIYEVVIFGTPVERNGFLIYNTTLYLWSISEEAFDNYSLNLNTAEGETREIFLLLEQTPEESVIMTGGLMVTAVVFGICVLLLASFGMLYHHNKLDLKLYCKDNYTWYNKDWKNDSKEYDAYISYCHHNESEDDLNFVVNFLKDELKKRRYKVIVRDIDIIQGTDVAEEVVHSLEISRCCILVISPTYVTSPIGNYGVSVTMDRMANYKRQIVPIIYRDCSVATEINNQPLLKHIMENVKCLTWPEQGSESRLEASPTSKKKRATFWKELMLRMPPLYLTREAILNSSSQAELMAHEDMLSGGTRVPTNSFQNEFSPVYPNPTSDFSTSHSNVATLPDTLSAGNSPFPALSGKGPAKLYPVLT